MGQEENLATSRQSIVRTLPWVIAVIAVCCGVIVAFQGVNRLDIQSIRDAGITTAASTAAVKTDLDQLKRDFEDFKREQRTGLLDLQKLLDAARKRK